MQFVIIFSQLLFIIIYCIFFHFWLSSDCHRLTENGLKVGIIVNNRLNITEGTEDTKWEAEEDEE